MICKECAVTGDANRKKFESPNQPPPESHPEGCGCACMHKKTTQWEKQFGVKRLKETEEA